MTLNKYGQATLERDHLLPADGRFYEGSISRFHFARLAQLAALADNMGITGSYRGQWTDDYTTIIKAKGDNGDWEVSDYGKVAPPAAWALETLLHSTYQEIKWSKKKSLKPSSNQ